MKYGNLNFLESSGPLQASNGTALYLLVILFRLTGVHGNSVSQECSVSCSAVTWSQEPHENSNWTSTTEFPLQSDLEMFGS